MIILYKNETFSSPEIFLSISAFITLVHHLSAHQNSINVLSGWEAFVICCTQGGIGAQRYWEFSDASQEVTLVNSCFLAMKTQRGHQSAFAYFLFASTLLIARWVISNNYVVQEKWKVGLQGSSYTMVSHIGKKKGKRKHFVTLPTATSYLPGLPK